MDYNTLNKIESMSPQLLLLLFFNFKATRRESPPLEKNANKHKRDDRNRKALFHNHHSNIRWILKPLGEIQ